MAFLRTANALIVHPHTTQAGWAKVRTAAQRIAGVPSSDLSAQASEILGEDFNPSKYLLSHCTIVASVTAKPVPNVKLGKVKDGSRKVNRKWAEYLVTPETDQWINNNCDAFSREVLSASYRTFIGATSYLEHVQVPELAKGRIIDAVLRDIGETLYVDILVANDRKHAQLIDDIESGRLTGLSMGCQVSQTQCTKCGNVAVDETEICQCCKYEKGNYFIDEWGNRRRVAELCGHPTEEPNAGVTFIEASWVASPAFTGAVMRNIIMPDTLSAKAANRVQEVLASPPAQWVDAGQRKAASTEEVILQDAAVVGRVGQRRLSFDFGDEPDAAEETPAPEGGSPFGDVEDRVMELVLDRVEKRVKDELDKRDKKPAPGPEDSTAAPNDTLVKEAALRSARHAFRRATLAMMRTATSDADLVNKVAVLDASFGVRIPVDVYRAALAAGPASKHSSADEHLEACRDALGRPFSPVEARALTRLGQVLNRAVTAANNVTPDKTRSLR